MMLQRLLLGRKVLLCQTGKGAEFTKFGMKWGAGHDCRGQARHLSGCQCEFLHKLFQRLRQIA